MPHSERIGFLGLGIMGSRMAASLRRAGYHLSVWTHTPGKAETWASEHGASACGTPADVATCSDIVITMVVDGAQVREILLGAEGVASASHQGLLAIDSSTIGPTDAVAIGTDLHARGIAMLDAPVTGSSPGAEKGTLTIMVGGADADYERALPVLQAMGELIVHVGELGQGQMVKLINNALGAANAAAVAEALVLARATGVDLDALEQIVGAGSGGSFQLQLKGRPMRDHDFATLFKTAHMLKDVRLCLDEADGAGAPFAAAAHARDLLAGAIGRGHADDDYCSLVESVEGLANRRLDVS